MTDWGTLRAAAKAAMGQAYAPYSSYPVGAALACDDGTVVTGCNVENASYPAGICAERTAVAAAVAHGHRRFSRIAICTGSGPVASPCGICRQVLMEFAPSLEIVSFTVDGREASWSLASLLPAPFVLEPHDAHGGSV